MSSWHQYDPLPSACRGQLRKLQPLTSHPSGLSFQSWSGTTQWQSSKFQGSTNFTKLYLSHLKIPDATRSVISRKFCIDYLDLLGTTTKNSVTLVTWCLRFTTAGLILCLLLYSPHAPYGLGPPDQNSRHYLQIHVNKMAILSKYRCKYNRGWILKPCRCEALIHRTPDPYQNNRRQICIQWG